MSQIKARYILFDTNLDGGINARLIPAYYSPTSYAPVQAGTEGADKISAHLKGIDAALATSVSGTPVNTPNTLVKRDGSGNFAAGTITATLSGNASTATSSISFTGSLVGDITGTQGATVVSTVGGSTAANVHAAELAANAATALNTASTLVKRDSSGNFAAGTITANLNGNANTATSAGSATTAGSAVNFTGSLSGDVTGTQGSTVVASVGGSSAANVHAAELAANAATNANTFSTLVKRDASGNFSATTITANLTGNATSATTAGSSTNFSGSLSGDVTGTQSATVVGSVGGSSAASIHSGEIAANSATSTNTVSTIVKRDSAGNFSAGTITAALSGNATTASTAASATNFTGSLVGDVTGTQGSTVVATVGGSSAANVHSAELLANAATSTNTTLALVRRDGSGNFAAGTITANLTGTVTGSLIGNASTATNFTGTLAGDVTGTQGATVVGSIGGSSATNVHNAELAANAATNVNTVNTLVKRDSSGNFAAGTITASLVGNASSANTAISFTGSLSGDVTGTQSATVVSSVGGSSALNVHNAELLANAATQNNTASTIVRRDSSGNFSATTITSNLVGNVTGTATFAGSFTGVLLGDVTGPQGVTTVALVGGSTAANVHAAELLANAATASNTSSTIVRRDGLGNFTAGTVFSTIADSSYNNFTQVIAPATPASTKSSLYTSLSNGFSRLRFVDDTGLTITLGRDVTFLVKNTSGSTINKGQAVYSTGADVTSGLSTIGLARANAQATVPATGLAMESIANGAIGRILHTGILTGIDTSAFTLGQTVYVSASTAGALTATRPAFPNIWQRIGVITIVNGTTGAMEVRPLATHGEESGTLLSNFSVGPGSGALAASVSFANANTGVLSWNPSASFTLALPPTQGSAGTTLVNDGAGNLSWNNILSNIDGGTASSVYTSNQSIIGGTA